MVHVPGYVTEHELYDPGVGDHEPPLQVEYVDEGQVDGAVTEPDEYVVQPEPLVAAPQAPYALQPAVHELYEYGVDDHEPLLHVDD